MSSPLRLGPIYPSYQHKQREIQRTEVMAYKHIMHKAQNIKYQKRFKEQLQPVRARLELWMELRSQKVRMHRSCRKNKAK